MNAKATELLMQAVRECDMAEMKAAVAAGADLDHNGGEPLQILAEKGNLHCAKMLILKGASTIWARKHAKDKQDQAGARYAAAKSGSEEEIAAIAERVRQANIIKNLDAYDEVIKAQLQILQVMRQEDMVAAVRELTEEVRQVTRPRDLDKPAPSLKSATAKGNAP